jgi:superfamily I DNA/RNA helicase
MVEIKEFKRDESKDYLFILRSLNEIPFPLGKKLLVDFLIGDMNNKSILKNNLYDLHNFGSLEYLTSFKIESHIEELIQKGMIDLSSSTFNKFIKVLSISRKGQNELLDPNLNSKKISGKYNDVETEINDQEIQSFKELGDFLEGFNLEQKKAIVSQKEKILCVAGAGSGKTTVLTKRIQFLNKYEKIRGEQILAITFTRKAKEEMQKRLEKLGIRAVVETFNSFCEKILLKNGGRIYRRRMRVAGYQDKMIGLLRALDNLNIGLEIAIEKYFSLAQRRNKNSYQLQNMLMNDCFSVLDFTKIAHKNILVSNNLEGKDFENAKLISDIVKFLEKHMAMNNLRTYADQVNDAISFFKMYPKLIPNFKHILVDEYQDVNSQQIELLSLLNSDGLFCVGDPRQSIFGWRGSDVNYILDFNKRYVNSETINLKKNYRSNSHVVKFMNESIKEMKMPDLEYHFESEKHLKLCKFNEELSEFQYITKEILNTEIPFEDIFVLARTNRQLNELGEIFKKNKIPHVLKNDDAKEVILKEGEVVLATIHSIKGLEAELVFVVGCTPNNFPCRAVEHPVMELVKMYEYDKEEEERRLFYVAISRAKNKLYLTYSGKRHTYFINEEMQKDLDKE